jgi:hypothetical protein
MTESVYFAAASGRIKIGTTTKSVSDRIKSINAHLARPLKIIGSIDGGISIERAVQKHLGEWHIKGEWFTDCDEIRTIIRQLIIHGPRAIGYEQPATHGAPDASVLRFKPDPLSFQRAARMMWGDRAEREIALLADVDEATSAAWLSGQTEIPRLVRYAVAGILVHFSTSDGPAISFAPKDLDKAAETHIRGRWLSLSRLSAVRMRRA